MAARVGLGNSQRLTCAYPPALLRFRDSVQAVAVRAGIGGRCCLASRASARGRTDPHAGKVERARWIALVLLAGPRGADRDRRGSEWRIARDPRRGPYPALPRSCA